MCGEIKLCVLLARLRIVYEGQTSDALWRLSSSVCRLSSSVTLRRCMCNGLKNLTLKACVLRPSTACSMLDFWDRPPRSHVRMRARYVRNAAVRTLLKSVVLIPTPRLLLLLRLKNLIKVNGWPVLSRPTPPSPPSPPRRSPFRLATNLYALLRPFVCVHQMAPPLIEVRDI